MAAEQKTARAARRRLDRLADRDRRDRSRSAYPTHDSADLNKTETLWSNRFCVVEMTGFDPSPPATTITNQANDHSGCGPGGRKSKAHRLAKADSEQASAERCGGDGI